MTTDRFIKILVIISTIVSSIAVVLRELNKTSLLVGKLNKEVTDKLFEEKIDTKTDL